MYAKVFLISALIIIFNSSVAYSQENTTKAAAQDSIDRGTVMFESGDYAGAVLEFENAYSLTNNWEILYNIGICNEALRNYVGAADSFTRYLEGGRTNLNTSDIHQIEEKLRRLRLMIGTLTLQSNVSGAKILIDGQEIGNVPLLNKLINAGSYRLRLEMNGYETYEQDINIQGGQTREIHVALSRISEQNNTVVTQNQNQETQNQTTQTTDHQLITQTEQENRTTQQESESSPFYKRWWFWTIVGVVVVGAGVGTALAITKPIEIGVSYDDDIIME